YVVADNGGVPIPGNVPTGEIFQGLNMQEYRYTLNAVAKKDQAQASATDQVITKAQLVVKARLIPLFQFASFYANDLEILPGPDMTLSGPVHTNKSLFLGANNTLRIKGQVTVASNLFNKRKNDNSTYPDGRVKIDNLLAVATNLLFGGTGSANPTTNAMNPANVAATWGNRVNLGIQALSIPKISTLAASGDFYNKADIRLEYQPQATANTTVATSPNPTLVPFAITAIKRDADANPTSTTTLTEGQLRSLRQPVMIPASYGFCTAATAVTPGVTLTTAQQTAVANALYVAMVSQPGIMAYHNSHPASATFGATNLALTSGLKTALNALIDSDPALSGLSSNNKTTLKNALGSASATPQAIAALDSRCFVGAPLQDSGRDKTNNATGQSDHKAPYRFFNDRENREMRLLQINLESLTLWNKVGRYVTFTSGSVTDNNSGQGYSADQLLFNTAPADNAAPSGSFQRLGLAASDVSNAGLVMHATVNQSSYASAAGKTSPYGFALIKAQQMPGLAEVGATLDPTGLTVVSDQAVYVQGNYNTVNWQPASVLADSLNVLSSACLTANVTINKNDGKNCTGVSGNEVAADPTTVNTAFLSGTDITTSGNYNGGLENYPRFSENWSNKTLTYQGSFVSTGTPEHVSGTWSNQAYDAPLRVWDYDTRFNLAKNLPPLTPRFVFLRQEAFSRSFN
ncbi:MAG: hypothetical protein VKN60_02205, partial [Cyanobacteriota bacterium]|nr:hypothetical protein [Cyanobacteriota bacterium]